MNALINVSAFDIESIGRNLDIFLRWKNVVLQMLETCFSKERLLSESTPRFLTDDEEFTDSVGGNAFTSNKLRNQITFFK